MYCAESGGQKPPARADQPVFRILAFPKDRFRAERPFYALLADSLEAQGLVVDEFYPARCLFRSYDVLHLHHPEAFVGTTLTLRTALRLSIFLLLVWLQKMKGCRVIWTAHNEGPHEPGHPFLERLYWKFFPSLVDGVIYLSNASRTIIAKRRPGLARRSAFVVPHGDFRAAYANKIGRDEARSRLGYDRHCRVVAFVGNIRAYKGVTELVRAFVSTTDSSFRLIIAGKVLAPGLKHEILDAIGGDLRVRLVDDVIEAGDMQRYLNAADLVVLPFRRILNSGSAILALSFDRPILVPGLGSLRELQTMVGKDWIRIYEGDLTPSVLTDAVLDFVQRPRSLHAPLEQLAWTQIGRQTAAAYASCLRDR